MARDLLSTKFGANILTKSADIDIFRNSIWWPPLSFILSEFGTFRHHGCLFLELCANLVQTCHIIAEKDTCELTSGSVFGQDIFAWSCCIIIPNSEISSSSIPIYYSIYEIKYDRRPPSWICWGKLWTTHETHSSWQSPV